MADARSNEEARLQSLERKLEALERLILDLQRRLTAAEQVQAQSWNA